MLVIPPTFKHQTWRNIALAAMPAFLLYTHLALTLRFEHWVIAAFFIGLFSINRRTAWVGYIVLPFLLIGIGYDSLRLVMHLRPEIHVADLHAVELSLFGIDTELGRVIPPEFFRTRNHPVMDVLAGFAYLLYLAQTFAIGVWLIFKNDRRVFLVTWGFFFLNIAGWTTWILWPAAPPWYAQQYGLGAAVMDALPSAAGGLRFDDVFGITLFHDYYARSPNVFGAMPSLHCAYPTLALLVVWGGSHKALKLACALFAALMYFSAVYLQHHYVIDVMAGITYSIATFAGMLALDRWLSRQRSTAPEGTAPVGG